MSDNNFQQDLFGDDSARKRQRKARFLGEYSKQRYLPYLKIPIEYTIIIAIGVLVVVIIAYAIGVERGKRISSEKVSSALSQLEEERAAILEQEKGLLIEEEKPGEVEEVTDISSLEREEEIPAPESTADPYEGMREDYVGAPPGFMAEKETPPPTVSGSSYIIQLASFKDEAFAKEEAKKLVWKGVEAHVAKKGDWYQVYSAGYNTIDEARKAKEQLIEDYTDCYIRKVK